MQFSGDSESALRNLTISERSRLETYKTKFPSCQCQVFDVGQNPESRPRRCIESHVKTITGQMVHRAGILPCLLKGSGIMFAVRKGRWLSMEELFSFMGFPIRAEDTAICAGAHCQFS
eukprot:2305921-Alexandrium_andersonii.AAC.1